VLHLRLVLAHQSQAHLDWQHSVPVAPATVALPTVFQTLHGVHVLSLVLAVTLVRAPVAQLITFDALALAPLLPLVFSVLLGQLVAAFRVLALQVAVVVVIGKSHRWLWHKTNGAYHYQHNERVQYNRKRH